MWPYHRTRLLRNMGPEALSCTMFLLLNLLHLSLAGCCYSTTLQKRHPCIEKSMHHNCSVCFEVSLIFTFTVNRLLWKIILLHLLRTFWSILTCDEIHVLYAFSISYMHLIPCFSGCSCISGGDSIYMWCVLCSTYLTQWRTSQSCLVATPCIWNACVKCTDMPSELLS